MAQPVDQVDARMRDIRDGIRQSLDRMHYLANARQLAGLDATQHWQICRAAIAAHDPNYDWRSSVGKISTTCASTSGGMET